MQIYSGKSVFRGIAIGKISVYRKNEQQVKRVRTEDTKGELARYEAAKAAAVEQLQELYQKVLKEVGEANAAIFEIHQMMLDDGDYNESVENIIETQKVNGFATAVGFTISIVLMAGLREKIEYNDIPKPFRGMPIVLLTAGLMSIAFFGFSGMI